MGILQARILEWVGYLFQGNLLPDAGIKSKYPVLQVDSLPAEIPGLFFFFFKSWMDTALYHAFSESIKILIFNLLF